MCKIVIVDDNKIEREELKEKLASLYPQHEVVSSRNYKSKAFIELESAVDTFIDKYKTSMNGELERLTKRS